MAYFLLTLCLFPCFHLLSFSRSFPGKCPEIGPSFAYLWEACCCHSVQSASAIFFLCSCRSIPGKEGHSGNEVPTGFFECWPQRRQFRPLTSRSAAPDPVFAASLGHFHWSLGKRHSPLGLWLSGPETFSYHFTLRQVGTLSLELRCVPHIIFYHLWGAIGYDTTALYVPRKK